MDSSSEEEEINLKKEEESQSDVKSEEVFDENDYYNDGNEEYKEADYLPVIEPPKSNKNENKKPFENRIHYQTKETFMNFDEKFKKIPNEETLEDEFPTESAFDICDNYKISYNENIDYSSNTYDMYSKNHLRSTLIEQIKNLDWKNKESEIQEAKKVTNAYEDIHEKFFNKRQSLQLANINYLFEKELIKYNSIFEGFPALIVGDNGGFADFILYYTIKIGSYNPTIFVIPEKKNSIKDIKYRKEIQEKAGEHVNILNEFYEENKDIDENSKISVDFINNIAKKIFEKTESNMVDLFIARKVINFNPEYSQEIKYEKFLLINTLLAFKCLSYCGNFIIKLYDTFTPFTIGLIYMIFKNFESVTIFKPVTTRQYSSSRFLVAEKYLKQTSETTNNSIKYLEDFVTKYIEFRANNNYDVKYFLPNSELRNNEVFLRIIPEINNGITEKRIDALKEINNHINNLSTKLYDKMLIRKFFLNNWGIPLIHFDENLLLRNQLKNKTGNSNYHSKKIYTEKELVEMYGNAAYLDKNEQRLLEMLSGDRYKKNKKVSKEKEKPKQKTLDEKYSILSQKLLGKKRNNPPQNKEKKTTNKKSEKKVDKKENKGSKKNNIDDKKDKDKNSKNKKEDDKNKTDEKDLNDIFDSDGEDIFEYSKDVKEKLEKHEDE